MMSGVTSRFVSDTFCGSCWSAEFEIEIGVSEFGFGELFAGEEGIAGGVEETGDFWKTNLFVRWSKIKAR